MLDSSDDAQDYITTYTMDLVSNRLAKKTDNAATAQAIADFVTLGSMTADEVVEYEYDANDRMQWEKKDAAGTAEDTYTTYAWNAAGRDTGDLRVKTVHDGLSDQGAVTETTTFEYNVQGRTGKITTVKAGQTTEITYKYNLQGIRVEEATTAGGVTTTKSYLIDQSNLTSYAQVLEEYVDGQLAKTFTLGHDVLTQADAANGPLTLIYDGHGSTRALLDAAANLVQRYAYEAFGQMLDGQGLTALSTALTSLLYSGEMTDKLTGLQNLRDRLYDVRTGRFTQSDRYEGRNGDPASLHKYVYTHGNPVNGIDPSGQMTLAELKAAVTTIAVVGVRLWSGASALYSFSQAQTYFWQALVSTDFEDKLGYLVLATIWGAMGAANFAAAVSGVPPVPSIFAKVPFPSNVTNGAVALREILSLNPAVAIWALVHVYPGVSMLGDAFRMFGGSESSHPAGWEEHHFLTNKHSYYKHEFRRITDKYGLDLEGRWNREYLPHAGRHSEQYHEWVLQAVKRIDDEALGDPQTFVRLFEHRVKDVVRKNPKIMYKEFWNGQ